MKFKMAATAGLSLTLDPMGKMFQNASSLKPLGQLKPNSDRHKKQKICRGPCNDHSWAVWFQLSKWFQRRCILTEITNMIKAKLYMNVHWMVLYKLHVFCSDMKFKIRTCSFTKNQRCSLYKLS
jgi:hypothetical protein